jgi:hypothetical protein
MYPGSRLRNGHAVAGPSQTPTGRIGGTHRNVQPYEEDRRGGDSGKMPRLFLLPTRLAAGGEFAANRFHHAVPVIAPRLHTRPGAQAGRDLRQVGRQG